jgi:hypothetical protein
MSTIENTSRDSTVSDPTAVESLKLLLDYAIAEGTELHLPVVVLLLKMANLELTKSIRREVHLSSVTRSTHAVEERISS